MHFTGQEAINASKQTVWDYFMDPNKVAECAPGFKSMEILGPDHFKPTLSVGIGAVRATFTLDVHLVDLREPDHAGVTARGNAGGNAVEVRAHMDLTPTSETTTSMAWVADVNVSGALASVGGRLMEGTAQKLTAKFFECLGQKLGGPAVAS